MANYRKPVDLTDALTALDNGRLQWKFDCGWADMQRDPQPRVYPRNPERVSVIVSYPENHLLHGIATGGMCDGLDSRELKRYAARYRVMQ